MKKLLHIILVASLMTSISACASQSLIQAIDVTGMSLPEATQALKDIGFSNIVTPDVAQDSDPYRYVVVKQSVSPGKNLNSWARIVLNCQYLNTYSVYLDLTSEIHFFDWKENFDLDIFFDGIDLFTLHSGHMNSYFLANITEGSHELVIRKAGNPGIQAIRTLYVQSDLTFGCYIRHGGDTISLDNIHTENDVSLHELLIPNVIGMFLRDAMNSLESIGLKNIEPYASESIWDYGNWIVVEQSIAEGNRIDQYQKISLKCVRRSQASD